MEYSNVQGLIDTEAIASGLLAFKREPTGGKWAAEAKLNDKARDGLLRDIIAFANTHGGTLHIGIEASDETPRRAKALNAVPRVVDLAERLGRAIRDCVEPPLTPSLTTLVTDEASGAGVLTVEVEPSPLAPHWNRNERRCYRRIDADSVEMSMLDIQSLALDRAATAADRDALFARRSAEAHTQLHVLRDDQGCRLKGWQPELAFPPAYFIRGTVAPVMPLRLAAPITRRRDLRLTTRPVYVVPQIPCVDQARPLAWYGGAAADLFRPALREWRYDQAATAPGSRYRQTIGDGGVIESLYLHTPAPPDVAKLPIDYLFTIALSLLFQAERLRTLTGHAGLPFELDVEIGTIGDVGVDYFAEGARPGSLRFNAGTVRFPRYLVGAPSGFPAIADLLQMDVHNALGHHLEDPGMRRFRLAVAETAAAHM